MTGLETIREAYADPWVRLALKIRLAALADIEAPQKVLDFLQVLKLEAAALQAAAGKVDEPETITAILAQARKLKIEGALADKDVADVLAIAAYLRDGTVMEGYTFTN